MSVGSNVAGRSFVAVLLALLLLGAAPPHAVSVVPVALGQIAGMTAAGAADPHALLRIAVEYQPAADLDAEAQAMSAPAAVRRAPLTSAAFDARFGRNGRDGDALAAYLRANGAADIYVSRHRLVGGGIVTVAAAQRMFGVRFARFTSGDRSAIAAQGPLRVPLARVRDVRGVVALTTPRLADVPAYTLFRGDWYTPEKFREGYDAIASGGTGEHIEIIEDASDRFDLRDLEPFLQGEGAPPSASAARVDERSFAFKAPASQCGRDDRGQEPALDADAAITMAPLATVTMEYDDVCSAGNDGTIALQRALDDRNAPTVLVFPFAVGPASAPISALFGKPPIAMLEAAMRGIPLVVPAGDDGAYGYRVSGDDAPGVAYPCVSPWVICAGGTQLGDRDGAWDEAVWNDGDHATGGGVSLEPRPAWQDPAGAFEFSAQYVKTRIVPDLTADASGHLRVYWHGYGLGGVGGTSESAAVVGGQLAAVNSAVPATERITGPAGVYALAKRAPAAFRDIVRENDRGYTDNTLRPRRMPLPKNFSGRLPPAPVLVGGCAAIEPSGCSSRPGFDAVSGLGSLLETKAVDALRAAARAHP